MSKVYSSDGEFLFPAEFSNEKELLEKLKQKNVIENVSEFVIEEDHEGRLFITNGIDEVATVE